MMHRLWVHFSCLCFVSLYGLYLLYKVNVNTLITSLHSSLQYQLISLEYQEYKEILAKRVQQLRRNRHRPEQFTVLVREVPLCIEHKARACCVDHFFSKHHPFTYHSYQILYDGKHLEHLLVRIARYKTGWFFFFSNFSNPCIV